MTEAPDVRIAIIGTGFSGLGMAIRLLEEGVEDFVVLERASGIGGTWRDNTYPGCACDVPSHLYSFSFAPNPEWSRLFSPQPEIREYLNRVAQERGVIRKIRFDHEVRGADWDAEARLWRIATSRGELSARIVIGAWGPLTEPSIPRLEGIDAFEGEVFHSAEWNHDYDLAGKRVAVIGTGASAIQFVPKIQPEVSQLHLFQRTPPWVLPHPDRRISGLEKRIFRRLPLAQRAARAGIYALLESFSVAFTRFPALLKIGELAGRANISRAIKDPELRRSLTPDYRLGCKRILLSNSWYPALAAPNCELVTDGIREVRASSIVSADGVEREIDAVIYGTGFHVTDNPAAEMIRGRGGVSLAEKWQGSPQAYLGTAVHGFPNAFAMIGPNTGLGNNSMVFMIESHIAYILDAIRTIEREDAETVEVIAAVEEDFNERLQARMEPTVWQTGGCASWYQDAEGRNRTLWPGPTWRFRQLTSRFDPESYLLERAAPAADEADARELVAA